MTAVRRLTSGLVLLAALHIDWGAHAQQLAVRQYRIADGLTHDDVRAILQDSKGYLWIGTGEGLSRYDGYTFVNYTASDGFGVPLVNDLAEDPDGRIWVTTNGGGIARFLDTPADRAAEYGERSGTQKAFIAFRLATHAWANQVNTIAFAGGWMWCGTDRGLFKARIPARGQPEFQPVGPPDPSIDEAFVDRRGRLWLSLIDRLAVINDDAAGYRFLRPPDAQPIRIVGISEIEPGLLVATSSAVYLLNTAGTSEPDWSRLEIPLQPGEVIRTLTADSAGVVWIPTSLGLMLYRDGRAMRTHAIDKLAAQSTRVVSEDRDHNIWMGRVGGLVRLSARDIVSFTSSDGLPDADVIALAMGPNDEILAGTRSRWAGIRDGSVRILDRFDALPFVLGGRQLVCERGTHCWAVDKTGLYRLEFERRRHELVHPLPAGAGVVSFSARPIRELYRDGDGAIWFGTTEPAIYRAAPDAATGQVTRIPLDVPYSMAPLARDRTGTMWLANFTQFGRLRGSHVERMHIGDGLDESPRGAYVDSRGRLWIGFRFGGVAMTPDPDAATPQWTRYSTRNGLASDSVFSIAEDRHGRIYLVTNRGLDRLDTASGQIRHFTVEDGLPSDWLNDCLADGNGRVWVAAAAGLAMIGETTANRPHSAPVVLIKRIEVGSSIVPLPDSGIGDLADVTIQPGESRVVIQYAGVALRGRDSVRYQYQLEPVDPAWSRPTFERSVTYGRLGSGRYRFLVRAIDADGVQSAKAAIVHLTVLRPIWARWWFLASVGLSIAAGGLVVRARRHRHRKAIESIRRQVATDLHDDVGSGLAQIAIQSEVIKRQAGGPVAGALDDIARTARTLRESMSDIVWAVDPAKDRLSDLVERMRHAAFSLLDAEGLRVEFDAPAAAELDRVDMPMDRRRQLLLIYKEAVTNAGRHARASHLAVRISLRDHRLWMEIRDNGCGFDPARVERGQGLNSLASRAQSAKGQLTIESAAGQGTRIEVSVPVG